MKSTTKSSLVKKPSESREVKLVGHISRPVVGEGRNAPDRQMFFVNGRPCVLPQISKAVNEVYKGFNVTQSPFIFADIQMDTGAYDVNVSPDKRTILLHDQADLLENLKIALTELFEKHEQTVPISQLGRTATLPVFKQASFNPILTSATSPLRGRRGDWVAANDFEAHSGVTSSTDSSRLNNPIINEGEDLGDPVTWTSVSSRSKEAPKYDLSSGSLPRFSKNPALQFKPPTKADETTKRRFSSTTTADLRLANSDGFGESQAQPGLWETEEPPSSPPGQIPSTQPPENPRPPPNRAQRGVDGTATITIGDRSPITVGTQPADSPRKKRKVDDFEARAIETMRLSGFASALGEFMAPGSQAATTENQPRKNNWKSKSLLGSDVSGVDVEDTEVDDIASDTQHDETNSPQDLDDEIQPDTMQHSGDVGTDLGEDIPPEGDLGVEESNYIPEAESQTGVSNRAARLLKEAEELAAAEPVEILLKHNIRLFNNPRKHTTVSMVRFERTSLDDIKASAMALRNANRQGLLSKGESNDPQGNLDKSEQDEGEQAAEERLSLTVTKGDFFNMKIRGQFNKGFILATRGSELFIIDQHASDEKYNFETLQATTVVQNQPLVVPKTLELMAMDEIAVMDNLDLLKRNGFVVHVDPESPTGMRCSLVSLPMSRETVFGVEDLEELIHLIHQHQGSGTSHLRCSKIRSMFAMRACRKSVMVGRDLPVKAMESIVRHMGELDKPWNCPHGRPTMRHLTELGFIERWHKEDQELRGVGLKWNSGSWREVLEMYPDDSPEQTESLVEMQETDVRKRRRSSSKQ